MADYTIWFLPSVAQYTKIDLRDWNMCQWHMAIYHFGPYGGDGDDWNVGFNSKVSWLIAQGFNSHNFHS
jgi:hypothetical protein